MKTAWTSSEHGVINSSSAGSISENTASVELEDSLVSLNKDGNWLLSDGSLELGSWLLLEVVEVSYGHDTLRLGLTALW